MTPLLDLVAVEAFVLVAERQSFTRAAGVLNSTQAAVSLRIRRLEEKLGQRLFERSPRNVRLSLAGERFLVVARELLAANRRALYAITEPQARLAIGVTHHLFGQKLTQKLRHISEREAGVALHIRTGASRALMRLYDASELDAIIVLRHDENRRDGELLWKEEFGWFAAKDFSIAPGTPFPLALQPEPCSIRAMVIAALTIQGSEWRDAFVGEGAVTISEIAAAGLAIAPLAQSAAPSEVEDLGKTLGLPPLPSRGVVLHSQVSNAAARAALTKVCRAIA